MLAFTLRRAVLAVVLLLVFSFASFCLFAGQFPSELSPPGARGGLAGNRLLPQYWRWLKGVPSGRTLTRALNERFVPGAPTLPEALAHTAALLAATLVLVLALSLLVGTIGAVRGGSMLDVLLRGGSYVAWAVPTFLLALLVEEAVTRLGGQRGVGPFPVAGWPGSCPVPLGLNTGQILPCPAAGGGFHNLWSLLRSLMLPSFTLAAGFVGLHARYLRSSLAVALAAPSTTTARAKGVPERRVVLRHALRNALPPYAAALLSDLGAIFGAALAVDWIFQLNGVGSLFIREVGINLIAAQGGVLVPVYGLQALLLATALLLLVSSFLGECAVIALDPRVRPE